MDSLARVCRVGRAGENGKRGIQSEHNASGLVCEVDTGLHIDRQRALHEARSEASAGIAGSVKLARDADAARGPKPSAGSNISERAPISAATIIRDMLASVG